ncbi:hypothetical protein LTR94_025879 [Friedmanniomyces endolithicus]|nr:hypothetical protein LTR94_025879 [Friedmanniomyces endolithicus]
MAPAPQNSTGANGAAGVEARTAPAALLGSSVCRITPQATEGPYWIDPELERSDIVEDRKGVPLKLALQIIDAATCKPFERARVDIWHCDAQGVYSGFADQPGVGSTQGQTFLRGHVFTGSDGVARFTTIYPGWYRGRTAHIHVKVFLDDEGQANLLTCQLFFPDALSEFLFLNASDYRRTQPRDTFNSQDGIAQAQGYANFGMVSEQSDHYAMGVVLAVDRSARNEERGFGMPRGGPPPLPGAPGDRSPPRSPEGALNGAEALRPPRGVPGGPPRGPGQGRPGEGPGGAALTGEARIAALIPSKAS